MRRKRWRLQAAEHRDRIELFFLPRNTPERNADEYLNNDMKGLLFIAVHHFLRIRGELHRRIQGFAITVAAPCRSMYSHVVLAPQCVRYGTGT